MRSAPEDTGSSNAPHAQQEHVCDEVRCPDKMPGLVFNLLRSSIAEISHFEISARFRDISRSAYCNPSCGSSGTNSISDGSHSSDADEHVIKRHIRVCAVKKYHELSLLFCQSLSSLVRKMNTASCSQPAVDWSFESPPIVFYGTPENSTGALISGQLFLDIQDDKIDIDSFKATLNIHTSYKRAFRSHCHECQNRIVELQAWVLLDHTTRLYRGRHAFPFSALLNGDLPASTNTPLVCISYEFRAVAHLSCLTTATARPVQLKFDRTFSVKRSVPEPLFPHHSARVFPGIDIKASADYTTVIYPTSTNKLFLKLDGLAAYNERLKYVDLWRLKKVTWKFEEAIQTIVPACNKHIASSSTINNVRGILRKEVRIIGERELHDGWKSNYSRSDGSVDMEIDYYIDPARFHTGEFKYACGMKTADGTKVKHCLLLELFFSKEYQAEGVTHHTSWTSTGCTLRMRLGIVLTDHAGLGVSWDSEAPPVYEDVPPSPPAYPSRSSTDYQNLELPYIGPSGNVASEI